MSSTQTKTPRHAGKQENGTHDQKKNNSIEVDLDDRDYGIRRQRDLNSYYKKVQRFKRKYEARNGNHKKETNKTSKAKKYNL